MNHYANAIKILSKMDASKALVLIYEIAANNPKNVCDAHEKLFGLSTDRTIVEMGKQGFTKIECIKKYRELTGCSLKEAKESVERIYFGKP